MKKNDDNKVNKPDDKGISPETMDEIRDSLLKMQDSYSRFLDLFNTGSFQHTEKSPAKREKCKCLRLKK